MSLLLGVAVLALLLWAANSFSKADPKAAARLLRTLGGVVIVLFAGFLLLRGEIGPAITVGLVGLGMLGWVSIWPATFGARTQKSAGQVSRVRTAFIEMELDHDSGSMHGRILAGAHQGETLDALDPQTLIGLLGAMDADSRDLLAAYLDRRAPEWREHAQGDAAAGSRSRTPGRGSKMTEEEAYQILGIQAGASAQDISRAHRSLMKKLHPDQGGSTYLAARVNEAKDVLMSRHR
ncbi:MAG TPA: DnaJ domain-containing protein [Xanthobacteraceae bacterium]|nr:DnaJ domain-containing protein [Xanthobacteraceae bacterium]